MEGEKGKGADMEKMAAYDDHVRANNLRLVTLTELLGQAPSFHSACTELISWCKDPRAFVDAFEQNLLTALQVVMSVASKDGFDLDLSCDLVSTCFQHRRNLSKDGATKIGRWYEQLRRRRSAKNLKLKKQKELKDAEELQLKIVSESGGQQQQESCTAEMWPAGANGGPVPPNGVSPSTPGPSSTGALPSPGFPPGPGGSFVPPFAMMSPSFPMQPMVQSADGQPVQGMAYPGGPMQQNYPTQQQLQQQQQQFSAITCNGRIVTPNDPQYPHVYNMMMRQRMMMARQQQMQQAQQMAAMSGMASPHFAQQPAFAPNGVPVATQRAPGQTAPLIRYPMGAMPQGAPMTAPSQGLRVSPPVPYSQVQQTAGAQQQVVCMANPNAPPNMEQVFLAVHEEWLQFGTLEHSEMQKEFVFDLPETNTQNIKNTPQLEVILKAILRQAPPLQMVNKKTYFACHPGGYKMQMELNGHPVQPTRMDQPIFVKSLLNAGQNRLTVKQVQCCCNVAFSISLVERTNRDVIVDKIFKMPHNLAATVESCREKTRTLAQQDPSQIPGRGAKVVLGEPNRRLTQPARSQRCNHAGCFELGAVVQEAWDGALLTCPICKISFDTSEVEVDRFIASILTQTYQLPSPPLELCIDPSTGDYTFIPVEETQARYAADAQHQHQQRMAQQQAMQAAQAHAMGQQQQRQMMAGMQPQPAPAAPAPKKARKRTNAAAAKAAAAALVQEQNNLEQNGGYPLKRIKSEPVGGALSMMQGMSSPCMPQSVPTPAMMMGQAGPPTPAGAFMNMNPPSVGGMSGAMMMYPGGPGSVPHHHSVPNMMSPFAGNANASPMKREPMSVSSPSTGMQCGPSTPTAAAMVVPSPRPPTAPMQGMQLQQVVHNGQGGAQGEPPSHSGSAPYTPSSVGSSSSTGQPSSAALAPDLLALEQEINVTIDPIPDIQEYLQADKFNLSAFDDIRFQNGDTPPQSTDDGYWNDVSSIIGSRT